MSYSLKHVDLIDYRRDDPAYNAVVRPLAQIVPELDALQARHDHHEIVRDEHLDIAQARLDAGDVVAADAAILVAENAQHRAEALRPRLFDLKAERARAISLGR